MTYDCSAAPVNGLRKCVRSQTGGSPPPSITVIARLANANSRPVFTATTRADSNGVQKATYVRTIVEVPERGELSSGSTKRVVLDDGFYLRNVNALL